MDNTWSLLQERSRIQHNSDEYPNTAEWIQLQNYQQQDLPDEVVLRLNVTLLGQQRLQANPVAVTTVTCQAVFRTQENNHVRRLSRSDAVTAIVIASIFGWRCLCDLWDEKHRKQKRNRPKPIKSMDNCHSDLLTNWPKREQEKRRVRPTKKPVRYRVHSTLSIFDTTFLSTTIIYQFCANFIMEAVLLTGWCSDKRLLYILSQTLRLLPVLKKQRPE